MDHDCATGYDLALQDLREKVVAATGCDIQTVSQIHF